MRVYKPSYTKLLPEKAKIFTRKGKQFAKFKDAKGHTTEARLTKSGDKILVETQHYHIEFEDSNGIRRRLKAYTNERASERLADKIESLLDCQRSNRQLDDELSKWLERIPAAIRDELIKFGLLDANRTAAGKKLIELVDGFEKSLSAKERCPDHIKETITLSKHLIEGCRFKYWSDISPAKVEAYLKSLREKGISYRRSNAYLQAAKQFCQWMVQSDYASESPLRHLQTLNAELDRRRVRRVLDVEQVRLLLEHAATQPMRFGIAGYERYLLYRFAIETGLRANEIRTLTVGMFDFDNLTVTVQAESSKHRRLDVQMLRPEFAAELKEFFKGKMPNIKAFGGTCKKLTARTAGMLKADLDAAGIPYEDDNGRVFDFHALRHQTGSLLAASGVHPKVAQSIMRHADINLTMGLYTHTLTGQEAEAVSSLPDLSLPSREKQKAVKTGTDDSTNILSKSCFQGAPIRSNADNSGNKNAVKVQKTPLCDSSKGASQKP